MHRAVVLGIVHALVDATTGLVTSLAAVVVPAVDPAPSSTSDVVG